MEDGLKPLSNSSDILRPLNELRKITFDQVFTISNEFENEDAKYCAKDTVGCAIHPYLER